MRAQVDAACKSRDDHVTGGSEVVCKTFGKVRPAAEALREPTIATIGDCRTASRPRTRAAVVRNPLRAMPADIRALRVL